ncbi:hypothetical protein [Kribbella sp.]|uniref:hypothetical protein n=1 Tax=Kribbella sp. TaxID=1871183 RepID=UPI002D6CD1D4|nr:hypothetical protein [Kribbella sp.]HZX03120.1 hypothetical protein [Kribbella sp.]
MSLARNLGVPENWYGGFYELAICLGPPDDDRLDAALRSVWRCASVEGCFGRAADRHLPVACSLRMLQQHGHLAGVVRLPDGGEVVCGVTAVREPEGDDWLDFYLPLGALCEHDPRVGGFPFGEAGGTISRAWREPIESWLANVGAATFAEVPFGHAIIGFEASGTPLDEATEPDRYYGVLVGGTGGVEHLPVSHWDFDTSA